MHTIQLPYSRIQPDNGQFKRPKHEDVSSIPPYLLIKCFCCVLTAPLPYILYSYSNFTKSVEGLNFLPQFSNVYKELCFKFYFCLNKYVA